MLYDPKWEVKTVPSAKEVLVSARKLIEPPEKWGQGAVGLRKGDGTLCALQALCAVADSDYIAADISDIPGAMLLSEHMGGFITCFNDSHSHAEVLAAFDKAIAASS